MNQGSREMHCGVRGQRASGAVASFNITNGSFSSGTFREGVELEDTSRLDSGRRGSTLQHASGFCSSSEQPCESERVRCEEECVRDRGGISLMWWLCSVDFEKAVFLSGHAKASGLQLALIDGYEGRASEWWPDHEPRLEDVSDV